MSYVSYVCVCRARRARRVVRVRVVRVRVVRVRVVRVRACRLCCCVRVSYVCAHVERYVFIMLVDAQYLLPASPPLKPPPANEPRETHDPSA